MKKYLFWAIAFFWPSVIVDAQDIITKKDGTDIKAKITEVNASEIKYKRFDNLEGPTYTMNKADILLVRYENGTNDVFDTPSTIPARRQYDNNKFFASDPSRLHDGMKYRHIKDFYDKNDYNALSNPKYSGSRAWLNLIVPGLAQFTMGEGGLGCRYLLLTLAGETMMFLGYGFVADSSYGRYVDEEEQIIGLALSLAGVAATLTFGITSITNASKVAKIKSLYEDDMAKLKQGYSFTVAPTLMPAYTPQGIRMAPGVGMRVTF